MEQRPIRFGIIGCGIIADIHAQCIESTDEAELAAVFDTKPESAAAFVEKYGGDVCGSLEELLARPDVEAVCICTPSGLHADQTVLAAKAGKHVLVEKPMAIRLEDAERMIEACHEAGVRLATVFPRRMSPQANYARQLIQEGRLGKLSLCSAYVMLYRDQAYYDSAGWRGTWAMDGGGAMMNQGIHTVDLLQWLAGPVTSLSAKAKAVLRSIEVEDTVTAALEFASGALGILEITTTARNAKGQRLAIRGERGELVIEEDDIVSLQIDGEDVTLPEFEAFRIIPDGHRMQIEDLARAIREGRQPIVPGTEGIHSLEIILGTYEASRQRKDISIGEKAPAI
ncbi:MULTISPECIES: Gfo/Idh/MocA family protein [Paenibacillus]|uniref:Oxidoreductase domain protein n=2 Tax=Paenibacillus lactis TaxID=228574 RepID=G4HK63_9BACL|nr:Gfo/Idh/MocA family oxidoreductase [Paenibacillus lactis]EHB62264.1 oxidoreductase domain protein [Paenibacillus lactis 154]MBP1895617.1 putative dehydrogenase [Paenibacillus lactis]GIO93790.1 oxidoreductase [Paenibacillus lactis]HAG00054.1 gfo/Idh/MocA family oxidoreductase [Paenibacillus lactis]